MTDVRCWGCQGYRAVTHPTTGLCDICTEVLKNISAGEIIRIALRAKLITIEAGHVVRRSA